MEEVILRTLSNAGGPRSTSELAKGCKSSCDHILDVCNKLSESGNIIKITDTMWCFNPKGNKQTNISSTMGGNSRRYTTQTIAANIQRLSSHDIPNARVLPCKRSREESSLDPVIAKSKDRRFPGLPSYPMVQSGTPCAHPSLLINQKLKCPSPLSAPRSSLNYEQNTSSCMQRATRQERAQFNKEVQRTSSVHIKEGNPANEIFELLADSRQIQLTGIEKVLYDKIKSSNNPWTLKQLKQSVKAASHSICSSLADKGLVIKINMVNDEPMYTINLKNSASNNETSLSLKRPYSSISDLGCQISKQNRQISKQDSIDLQRLDPNVRNKILHDSINKNPISAVVELGQALGWTPSFNIIKESGPKNRKKFHMRLTLGPRTFDSVATNKKDAKQNVAELALRMLHSEDSAGSISRPSEVSLRPTDNRNLFEPTLVASIAGTGFFGKVGSFSYETYNRLASTLNVSTVGRKVIAVFIMEDSRSGSPMWCPVSLGTGNRTVNGENISFEGKTVNDSHAEIIARRGFRRFLWQQLRIVAGKENNTLPYGNVLESSEDGLYRIKDGILFHLFISTAPCGDSAIFPVAEASSSNTDETTHHPIIENEKQGLLRSKMESGQGTNPTSVTEDPLTVDGVMMGNQRLKTMSCSDKVSRWNVLGLQGCLLARFLHPVYLSTLTLGCLYNHGHLSRAVCCRYNGISLPPPYRLNHPLLGCVPGQEAERELGKTNEKSLNWSSGDSNVEVLDGCRGRVGGGSAVSRIARVNILREYSEYCGVEYSDYSKAKEEVTGYCAAKKVYDKFISDKKYGVWIKKPVY